MPTVPESNDWRLACFDLDGTLVRGTTVSQHLADRFGQSELMAELERRYATGEISNSLVAQETARTYRDIPLPQVVAELSDISCIEGIDVTLATLRERGIESLLGTVTWSFAAEEFGRRHGFTAVSGTEIELDLDGIPTGGVKRHFDEWDKLDFVRSYCKANNVDLAECIAVGDSRSDVPLFEAVGLSLRSCNVPGSRPLQSPQYGELTDILDLIPSE